METIDAVRIWRNGRVPVVYKPEGRGSLMVRVPYADDNREWIIGSGRLIAWIKQFRAWELPRSRFEDIVHRALTRYESVYVIQAYRQLQKCAPACWEATGFDCECACMGENHGSGIPLDHQISETFAFEWGGRQLACRLIKRRKMEA